MILRQDPRRVRTAFQTWLTGDHAKALAVIISVAIAYYYAALAGYEFRTSARGISPFWPSAGLAFGAFFLWGKITLPALFLGSLLSSLTLYGSEALISSIVISFGVALEAFLGVAIFRRLAPPKELPLDSPKNLVIFVAVAAPLSTLVAALWGVTTMCIDGTAIWSNFWVKTRIWWTADFFGDVYVAPLIIAWARKYEPIPKSRRLEGLLMGIAVCSCAMAIFWDFIPKSMTGQPLEYLCFPLLILAAFRFGHIGATTSIFLFTVFATLGTVRGHGPFVRDNIVESMVLFQLYIVTCALTAYAIAAIRWQFLVSQRAFEKAADLYQSLVEHLPINVFRKDQDGRVVFANQKFWKTLRLSPKTHLGNTEEQLFGNNLALKPETFDRQVTHRDDVVECVEKLDLPDNQGSYVQIAKAPIKDSDGRSIGILGAFWDVTHRMEYESRLRVAKHNADAANQAKTEFLANMSHEMRTPLNAIMGFVERLGDDGRSHTERNRDIDHIQRSVRNLTALIDDILDLSKVEAGKLKVERVRLNWIDEFEHFYRSMEDSARKKGLTLSASFAGKMPRLVETDPVRLRQILYNLVGNSIKFTEKGTVHIGIEFELKPKPLLKFMVRDTGRGISQSEKKRLFRAFVQADNSTTRKYGGTGLGLSLSKKLARALGGDVRLVSSETGNGSLFEASIYAGEMDKVEWIENFKLEPEAVKRKPPKTQKATRLDGLRILVAEDGPDNQEILSYFLTLAGAEVDMACDGHQAMLLAAKSSYDIILMDVQMPRLDGHEATERIREGGYNGPIVALTAHAMEEDHRKCIDSGCDGYITKPITRDALISFIKHYTRRFEKPETKEIWSSGNNEAS